MAKNFCLLPSKKKEFKQALIKGNIKIADLLNMETEARIKLFEGFAGKNAADVNLLFEQKLVLKNKEIGIKNALLKLTETGRYSPEEVARLKNARAVWRAKQMERILSPKEGEVFYKSLAENILKVDVDEATAKQVLELSKAVQKAETALESGYTKEKGLDFGAAKVAYDNFLQGARKSRTYEFTNPLKAEGLGGKMGSVAMDAKEALKFLGDNTRALVASVDNSLWGNQGVRVLLDPRTSKIWGTNLLKSINDFYQILIRGNAKGDAILDAAKAEVYSRKNFIDGLYSNKGGRKLDIGGVEEDFPTSLPARLGEIPVIKNIPVIKSIFSAAGRVFKASEVVYEVGALRLRADVADKMFDMAKKTGRDLTDPLQRGSINTVVNALTGRGYTGRTSELTDMTNSLFFSVKFFKSNLDFLTMHAFDPKVAATEKADALKHLLMVASSSAVILGIVQALNKDDTYNPFDPRSSDFNKIKIGNTRIGLGAHGSIVVLIAKILSQSSRSTSTGEVYKLNERDKKGNPKFGSPTGMDVFWDFTENKFSPLAGLLADLVKQQNFDRSKPTPSSIAKNIMSPMSTQSVKEMIQDKSNGPLLDFILTVISFNGFNANTYAPKEKK